MSAPEPPVLLPGVVDQQVARCMADYDAQIASEPSELVRRLMLRDRPQVEALIRQKTTEELAKAAFDLVGEAEARQ